MAAPERRPAESLPIVFYDGGCGLCHRTVLFLLDEDPEGHLFRFAPLEGETFCERIPEDERRGLPDSVLVLEPDGRLRTRSDAALALLEHLGGPHAARARRLRRVPAFLLDAAYALLAAVRHHLWKRPTEACPLIPPAQRPLFLP